MSRTTHDIAVVGGGLVGATTALALSRAGFDVALVERRVAPPAHDPLHYDPRVYAIAPHSMTLLDRLGVWPQIAARRVSPYQRMRVWVERADSELAFSSADVGRDQLGWIVEHSLLMDTLWQALDEVAVYAPAEIESIQPVGPGHAPATANLRLAEGRVIQARLLIAADGANSGVRRMAGIDTIGWDYAQRAIVCHVRTEHAHQQTAWQRFLRSGPLAFLPLADGRCSIVWSASTALAEELMALGDAAFKRRLGEASGGRLGRMLEVTPRLGFPLRLLQAQDYVRPGLALVGDAAHSIHPLAGQGVNLGFADVETLVAELRSARDQRRDWAGLRTLRRYARVRKSENLDMLVITEGLYRLFNADIPGLRKVLGVGVDGVNQLGPLKTWLARQAVGN